jgi:Tfp pilus assembly protein PilF
VSLLTDLLSRVKHDKGKSGVPPTLTRLISDSHKQKVIRPRLILVGTVCVVIILVGFGVIYMMDAFMGASIAVKGGLTDVKQTEKGAQQVTSTVQTTQHSDTPPRPPEGQAKGPTPSPSRIGEKYGPSPIQDRTGEESTARKAKREEIRPARTPAGSAEQAREDRDSILYSARSYDAARDYEQALYYYKKALEMDPKNYAVMNNLAGTLIRKGNFEEAIRYARDALVLKKDYAPAIINMGIAHIQLGKVQDGRHYLTAALALDPSNKSALLNLALLFETLKEFADAQRLYEKLAELNDVEGYVGIARLAEKSGRLEDARRIYREMLARGNLDEGTRKLAAERITILEKR